MLACLIFYDALLIGMNETMIKSATGSFLGEAQIHAAGFRDTQEVERTIHNPKQVLDSLKSEPLIKSFTPRALGLAMVTSPANVSSVLLAGIEPETERELSQVDDAIREGDFFSGESKREIVIGSKLAEILEVSLGDRIVITSAQAESGDLAQEMFRVSGIYHFNIKEMDAGMAFVRLPKAQKLLGIGANIHQIAITFTKTEIASQAELPFWKKYSSDENEAASWLTILPQFKAILEMTGMFRGVLALILMAVVVFGIINTLFMSLYERMFEFAVLRAVGTRPFGVAKLMLFEAGALGILSGIIGVIMGFILTGIVAKTGIDYRGIEFAGATFQDLLYPVMNIWQFIIYPAGVFIFTFLVGLYPAMVASRMSISESLRKSL